MTEKEYAVKEIERVSGSSMETITEEDVLRLNPDLQDGNVPHWLQIESITPTITELERVLSAMARWISTIEGYEELDDTQVVIEINTAPLKPGQNVMGFFKHVAYQIKNGKKIASICLMAQTLQTDNVREICHVAFHELIHLVNHVLGIKDCSKNGYHLIDYGKTAKDLGCGVEEPSNHYGYNQTYFLDETWAMIEKDISPDAEILTHLYRITPKIKKKKPVQKRVVMDCECNQPILLPKGHAEERKLLCKVCNKMLTIKLSKKDKS